MLEVIDNPRRRVQPIESEIGQCWPTGVEFNPAHDAVVAVELDITLRCNYFCGTCDRLVGRFDEVTDSDMTIEQVERFCEEVRRHPNPLKVINVLGGEPLIHPQVYEICKMVCDLSPSKVGRVRMVTNGVKQVPDEIRKLPGMHIRESHVKRKRHSNFYIAPVDLGMPMSRCNIPVNCGIELNAFGYWPCAPGCSIARLFQYPYMRRESLPISFKTWDFSRICPLCIFAGEKRPKVPATKWNGDIQATATWAKAIDDYEKHPPQPLTRWGE